MSELLGKLGVLLILPGVAQRGKPGLQQRDPVLKILVEPLQFFGEAADLRRIHDSF